MKRKAKADIRRVPVIFTPEQMKAIDPLLRQIHEYNVANDAREGGPEPRVALIGQVKSDGWMVVRLVTDEGYDILKSAIVEGERKGLI